VRFSETLTLSYDRIDDQVLVGPASWAGWMLELAACGSPVSRGLPLWLGNDYNDYRDYLWGVDMADTWTVAEAKAKLSEVIDRAAKEGPQTVTRHGRAAAVVVAAEEWERKTRRYGSLAEFLANSPLRRSKLRVERRQDRPRKVDL
jgi:prevent-host-death family protein